MAMTASRRRRQRGMTLVETLVGLALLGFVTVGVLELFSLSMAVNMGSLARTEMTSKVQQVSEIVRVQFALTKTTGATPDPTCCPLTTGSHDIPTSGACYNTFWGPAGANVIAPDSRYSLSYTIGPGGAGQTITVTATPNSGSSPNQYVGVGIAARTVQYVCQVD